MADFILRALVWVSFLLTRHPSPGRHRTCPGVSTLRTPTPDLAPALPWPRRMVDDSDFFAPLVGEEHDLVRPYIALHEREQERWRRERERLVQRIPLVGVGTGSRTAASR